MRKHRVPPIRRYFGAGLLVWLPLVVTVLILGFLVELMDRSLLLLPKAYHPDTLLGFHLPGLGVLLTLALVIGTGAIAANLFGRRLLALGESLLARVPLVGNIYTGTKQIAETLLSSKGQSFRKVLLIQYPRPGLWTIAFQTSATQGEAQIKTGREVLNVYVPTTPNPTSGFFLMVPREETIELDMPVETGLKMLLSMGVVVPPWPPRPAAPVADSDPSP